MTLSPDDNLAGEIAALSLVRSDYVPELTLRLEDAVRRGQLILNLRAEARPDVLGTAVREGLATAGDQWADLELTLDHLEHFRPGKPVPTHRVSALSV
jgi:hypothetical protein